MLQPLILDLPTPHPEDINIDVIAAGDLQSGNLQCSSHQFWISRLIRSEDTNLDVFGVGDLQFGNLQCSSHRFWMSRRIRSQDTHIDVFGIGDVCEPTILQAMILDVATHST